MQRERQLERAPGGVLATKLFTPSTPATFVPRPRLSALLEGQSTTRLRLVCAPAGFGKTAVLADWARAGQPAAWVSLDTADNDAVRFWRHVILALDALWPGVADDLLPALDSGSLPIDSLVAEVINAIATRSTEAGLILNDYQEVESRSVHASVQLLLDHLPPQLHLTIATRADPPLALDRLRARGQLLEVRADDLRFTSSEGSALLRGVFGAELPEATVSALIARTEGWAAGLELAALSIRGRDDPIRSAATFSGSNRFILDCLTEDALDRQPEALRTFLLDTSVVERLCGPLCDAITGRSDSRQLLEAIEAAGLFLVSLAASMLGQDEWLLQSFADWHVSIANWFQGHLEEAQVGLAEHARQWMEMHEAALAAWSLQYLGQVRWALGRLDSAHETYAAVVAARHDERSRLPAIDMAHVGLARIAYEWNQLDAAEEHATRGIALCRPLAFMQAFANGCATLVWIRQARGEAPGARASMEEAARRAQRSRREAARRVRDG